MDRHYTHVGRQIAGVTIMTSPRHPARLTEAARQAFFSLDQEIEDMGADIYGHQFCDDHPEARGHPGLPARRMCATTLAIDIGNS